MKRGKISYCLIDGTNPAEVFECEGKVVKAFFDTSPVFDRKYSQAFIQPKGNIRDKSSRWFYFPFNIFHLAAHGTYFRKTKNQLDYSVIVQQRGKREVEIFAHDTVVRSMLQADVFLSTCCNTFNDPFVEVLAGYGYIKNFIAPKDAPSSGDTIIFSLMFYNELLRRVKPTQKEIEDDDVIDAFKLTNRAYRSYHGKGSFKLYNCRDVMTYG